jgi:hypothetical protein
MNSDVAMQVRRRIKLWRIRVRRNNCIIREQKLVT